jgi:hypothetical protein
MWWLKNIERCAEEHGYTPEQQQEYRLHITAIAAWMRLYKMDQEKKEEAK